MKKILLGIGLCATLALAATYQENVINIKAEESVKIKPNTASFSVTVSATHANADSAILQVKPLIEAVDSIFKRYKIDNSQAVIKEMKIRSVYERNKEGERVPTGYEVLRKYELTYGNMGKLSSLLVDLRMAGASEFGQVEFSHTRIDSVEQIVLAKAIAKAHRIAQDIAKKSGVTIGDASIVSNEPPKDFSYENRVRIDFDFGTNYREGGIGSMLGGLLGGGGGDLSGAQLAKLNALKQFFKIDIEEIEVKNQVWATYPILSKRECSGQWSKN